MNKVPNQRTTIDGLDGLRALAALAVFGVHFNQTVRLELHVGPFELSRLLANGELGVSLFFSLSGFLLSLAFWHSLGTGGPLPEVKGYALRRIARIAPAYYACLTALIILGGLWQFPAAYPDIALHYAFLFNYTEFSIFSINAPFWTLAVEMQFYVLLPLVFVPIARASGHWRPAIVVILGTGAYMAHYWLMSRVTHMIDWPLDPRLTWIRPYGAVLTHSLLAHLPHFLAGVLACYLFLRANSRSDVPSATRRRLSDAVFWGAGALVLALSATELEEWIQIPYGRYGLPLVTLLLTAMIFTAPTSRLARAWLHALPLRWLGMISYGIYIYHLPCLMLVDRTMAMRGLDAADHGLVFGVAGLGLTIAIATVSFVAIERPVLETVRKRTRRAAGAVRSE